MRSFLAVALLASLLGCQARTQAGAVLPPLGQEGELYLYLQPLPAGADRLSFSLQSVAAVRSDGTAVPLEILLPEVSGPGVARQRLLAFGRLPPDTYTELAVRVGRASLASGDTRSDLEVSREAERVPVRLKVVRQSAAVLKLSLRIDEAVSPGHAFRAAFVATPPPVPVVQLTGYATSPARAAVAVFDKVRREVVGVIPTGREPAGLVIDPFLLRAYVALSGDDQVQVLDLGTGEDVGRIQLQPGDHPRDLALTSDGRTLVSANPGTRTVSFIDPGSRLERARLPVGDEPDALVLERGGQRLYVLNRVSNSINVVDVGMQKLTGTLLTDPEPIAAQLNRAGTRMYVAQAGSAYVNVYTLPGGSPPARLYVGLGTTTLAVDPRTDFLYVGRADGRLDVYDPIAFVAVDRVDLPGAPSWLVVDDVENQLMALLPEAGRVAFVDLTRRRVVGQMEVLPGPFRLAITGGRN